MSRPTLTWIWRLSVPSSRADSAIAQALESQQGEWEGGSPEPMPSGSRSQIQKLIKDGQVTLNGQPLLKANSSLPANSEIRITFPAPKSMELVPEDRPLEILFEDEHLIVLNKPQGLTVHPSATQLEGTLVHALLHHAKDLSGIGGVLRPGIVHRLDKDTSGAMVVTKTDAAHVKLVKTFSRHEIERRYWALCYGVLATPSKGDLKVESTLGRSPNDRKKMAMNVKDGRHAVSYFRLIESYGFASWVEARLETGRTHQVRVHLTGSGHSLLGDPVYGVPSERHTKWVALPAEIRRQVEVLPGQALHARVLGFEHPITGENLRFEAEPPEPFRLLLQALQRYL